MAELISFICRTCNQKFEMEADYLIPGVEGYMNYNGRLVHVVDPMRTRRMCDACVEKSLKGIVRKGGSVLDG